MSETVQLALLGGWRLCRSDRPFPVPPAAQRLIALVALTGRPSRSYVAGALWSDDSEHHAQSSLRTLLFRLRRRADLNSVLNISETSLCLRDHVKVDVADVVACATALVGKDSMATYDALNLLVCGELLPGWYDDWLAPERERLRQLRLHALEALAENWRVQGSHAQALDAALAAVRIEPLRESSNRMVVQVHLQEGNVAEALRQYRQYDSLLARELQIRPTDQMADLVRPYMPALR